MIDAKTIKTTERADSAAENGYYKKIALKLKTLKITLIILLSFFFLGGFLFIEDISFDNINFLLKTIDIIPAGRAAAREFRIDADENSTAGFYRNNIALLRRGRLDVYDLTGRRGSTFQLAYSNPILSISDRYILTYDLGMNKLDVFNAVSHVYEYIGEDPIFGARVSDSGFVVYITREAGYASVVKILNKNFSEIYAVYRVHDYIVDADINDTADYLVTAGFYAENGDYVTSILLYEKDSEKQISDIKIYGEEPYRIKLNSTGFCAVLENSVRFYDLSGREISYLGLSGGMIRLLEFNGDFSAVVLDGRTLGSDSRILIFDNSGNILYERFIDMEIINIKFSDECEYLHFLTRTGLYAINIPEKTFKQTLPRINAEGEQEYDETAGSIIFANEENIFLAGLSKIDILERPPQQINGLR